MRDYRKDAGKVSEDAALRYLQDAGLSLLLRNYRCKSGEIDLVMLEGKTLVLVEVRYRSSRGFGGAAASVDYFKQKRFISAAKHLLLSRADLRRYKARFDVIAIESLESQQIEWIKHAFELKS